MISVGEEGKRLLPADEGDRVICKPLRACVKFHIRLNALPTNELRPPGGRREMHDRGWSFACFNTCLSLGLEKQVSKAIRRRERLERRDSAVVTGTALDCFVINTND